MGQASRAKRKRAAVRSAKRSRNNSWWYGVTAIVLIIGVSLIVYARETAPKAVGPFIANQANPNDPHNADSHWHTALGVYDCDHWMGDTPGSGIWAWPYQTPGTNGQVSPARAGNTNVYAGLHSHNDGIIHMEPAVTEEAGRHATVGKYFEFGGWKLSSSGYTFLGTTVKNGDKCGTTPGTLQWAVGKFDGNVNAKQHYSIESGNPGDYKLYNDDIVIIAFLPQGKSITSLGNPPSLKNLPNALGAESQTAPTTMPPPTGTTPTVPSTAPGTATTAPAATTPTTVTSTSKP